MRIYVIVHIYIVQVLYLDYNMLCYILSGSNILELHKLADLVPPLYLLRITIQHPIPFS
jgi:hypothetical protein